MNRNRESEAREHDRLRELLRRHDAAAGRELAPAERARIRRAALATVPARTPALGPRLVAVAALLALSLLGAWWLRPGRGTAPPAPGRATVTTPDAGTPGPADPQGSATRPAAPEPPAPAVERLAAGPTPDAAPTRPATDSGDPATAGPEEPSVPPASAQVAARELQFETPGGTRLIWIFQADTSRPAERPSTERGVT